MSAQKGVQGSETEIRELLGGTEENSVSGKGSLINDLPLRETILLPVWSPLILACLSPHPPLHEKNVTKLLQTCNTIKIKVALDDFLNQELSF